MWASALAAVAAAIKWIMDRTQRQIGALQQKSASDDATIKGAIHARKIADDVHALSDDALNKRLRRHDPEC